MTSLGVLAGANRPAHETMANCGMPASAMVGTSGNTGLRRGNVVALGSGPVFAALYEWLGERHPLSRRWAVSTGLAVAGIVVSVLPVLVIYLLLQRYFVSGIVTGALRG